ncbi:methionine adenosyltransferase [Aureococcus anophagefferens]|uniref:Methionine adenosyltransferase n=1 Tax=Aureococcus anophagefferens TaxID=44056 RepID=A0ABR1FH28_AURAN
MAKDKASTRKPRRRNARRARRRRGARAEATPPVRASKRLSVQVSAAASAFLVNFRLRLDAIASIFVNYHEERQEFVAKTEAADLIEQNLLIQFVVLPRKMGTGRDSLEGVFLFATEAGAPAWLTLGFEHVGSSASLIHLRFDLLFKRDRGVLARSARGPASRLAAARWTARSRSSATPRASTPWPRRSAASRPASRPRPVPPPPNRATGADGDSGEGWEESDEDDPVEDLIHRERIRERDLLRTPGCLALGRKAFRLEDMPRVRGRDREILRRVLYILREAERFCAGVRSARVAPSPEMIWAPRRAIASFDAFEGFEEFARLQRLFPNLDFRLSWSVRFNVVVQTIDAIARDSNLELTRVDMEVRRSTVGVYGDSLACQLLGQTYYVHPDKTIKITVDLVVTSEVIGAAFSVRGGRRSRARSPSLAGTAPGRAEVQIKELGFHFVDPLAPVAEKEIVPRVRVFIPYLGIEGWISITSRGPALDDGHLIVELKYLQAMHVKNRMLKKCCYTLYLLELADRLRGEASRETLKTARKNVVEVRSASASTRADATASSTWSCSRARRSCASSAKFANAIARKAAEARGETFVPTPYDETAVDAVVVTAVPPVAPVATLVADGAKKVVFQYVGAKKGSANGTDYLVARWRGLARGPLRLEFDELAGATSRRGGGRREALRSLENAFSEFMPMRGSSADPSSRRAPFAGTLLRHQRSRQLRHGKVAALATIPGSGKHAMIVFGTYDSKVEVSIQEKHRISEVVARIEEVNVERAAAEKPLPPLHVAGASAADPAIQQVHKQRAEFLSLFDESEVEMAAAMFDSRPIEIARPLLFESEEDARSRARRAAREARASRRRRRRRRRRGAGRRARQADGSAEPAAAPEAPAQALAAPAPTAPPVEAPAEAPPPAAAPAKKKKKKRSRRAPAPAEISEYERTRMRNIAAGNKKLYSLGLIHPPPEVVADPEHSWWSERARTRRFPSPAAPDAVASAPSPSPPRPRKIA